MSYLQDRRARNAFREQQELEAARRATAQGLAQGMEKMIPEWAVNDYIQTGDARALEAAAGGVENPTLLDCYRVLLMTRALVEGAAHAEGREA